MSEPTVIEGTYVPEPTGLPYDQAANACQDDEAWVFVEGDE